MLLEIDCLNTMIIWSTLFLEVSRMFTLHFGSHFLQFFQTNMLCVFQLNIVQQNLLHELNGLKLVSQEALCCNG